MYVMRTQIMTTLWTTRRRGIRAAFVIPLLVLWSGIFSPVRPVTRTTRVAPGDTALRSRALHLLNRLSFGARPRDVERVLALGFDRYLEEQLHPERIPDGALEKRVSGYEILHKSPAELARVYAGVVRERREAQRSGAAGRTDRAMEPGDRPAARGGMTDNPLRRLLGEYQQVTLTRAVLSERQLYEVMVDFWTNHFNVFIGKGADRFLLPGYIEETIRPRALGKFEDLLLATAQSPAMLFYLDNAQSVAPGSRPPRLEAARARRGPRGRRWGTGRMDSVMAQVESRMPKGINENYAREVMELHTLGVDGGYTQQDVENLARILTGWSISRTRRDPDFVFNDWAHDRGAKVFLGREFPPGQGHSEGMTALRLLARHPATMRHVSSKLCARFVSDDASDGCVDAGVHAWQRTGGDIREVVRAIVTSPEFWHAQNRAAKIKTPMEFVVSAMRAVGAEPDSAPGLGQVLVRLGQPLFGQQAPTGYPETQDSWVNAGALLQRMNVALGLATGRLPGAIVSLDAIAPVEGDIGHIIEVVNATVLNGSASPGTLLAMRHRVSDISTPDQRRAMIVALALGSPDFQKQ